MKQMLAIAGLALFMASCSTSYEKTESGLAYKIYKGDGKRKLKAGDLVKFYGLIKIQPRDTVLFTNYGKLPEYLPVDTSRRLSHDFNEVLSKASVGDSLVVISQVDTLVKRGMAQYNEMFKRGDQIFTSIKVIDAFSNRDEQANDQKKELDKQKAQEVAQLETYLKKNGIKAQKTENGVYVQKTNTTNAPKAVNGQEVTVNYTGSLLDNGKVFDSNTDTSFHHVQPIPVVLGSGSTIRGWEEGLLQFGKGEKGTLYIPSMLGYGPPGAPPAIPGYAPLKFDVEVLDVKAAPAPQPMAGPNGDPRQQAQQQMQEQQNRQK